MNRRVVITGIGINSVLGDDKNKFWDNIVKGESGITDIDVIDTSEYKNKRGAQIKNNNIDLFVTNEEKEEFGKCSQWAIASARLALKDSNLIINDENRESIGVAFGTTEGEVQSIQNIDDCLYGDKKAGDEKLKNWIKSYPCNRIPVAISKSLHINGDCIINSNACTAANYAIGYSYDLIKSGKVDYMIAGGSDVFSRVAFTGFNRLLAVAHDKVKPFDANRTGMMVGEGSAAIILETLESAINRKAHIYGEVLGYGISNDAYHITTPHPKAEGVISAMDKAIKNSNISKDDIEYISLHGTGTNANDKDEMFALDSFFGDRCKDIMASSVKGALGHSMGAASAIEMVVCALILDTGIIPPTINVDNIDEGCTFNLIANKAEKHDVSVIMNNAYAFGGCNSCIVMKKYDGK